MALPPLPATPLNGGAATPGLSPNLRLDPLAGLIPPEAADAPIVIADVDDPADMPVLDDDGKIIHIEHEDGSITIGTSLVADDRPPPDWFDNLVDRVSPMQLGSISEELLRGIREDNQSRTELLEALAMGIRLMATTVDEPQSGGSAGDAAPVSGISTVRHPLLQESVLRFQANARAELLPTDGPCKIRVDDNTPDRELDQLADDFENDMNHFLTVVATEFVPDSDRMLLLLGLGGTSFKKVYYCPMRNRPTSETVNINDLIVHAEATDLQNARRITQEILMKPSTVRRMQILGIYRDIGLADPMPVQKSAVGEEMATQQGVQPSSIDAMDRDRLIHECYCELDLPGFEHKWKGKPSGLPIPYRVTIDDTSREILAIVRDYDRDTEDLPTRRTTFIKYTFVPGFGFYGLGLLHILGNTTNALTALWREMIDAGMFANFPGFLFSQQAGRQKTNVFRVPPGGGAPIDTGGQPIGNAVMPLPYKEPGPGMFQLVDGITQTGMRLGGTAENQVGEGRADAPVGTTLAMIEQAAKVMNSVHKRLHAAQAEELQTIVKCFREHPESFWKRNKRAARAWDEQTFLNAIDTYELVPQADPNTASHVQRMMKAEALFQMAVAKPEIFDPIAVAKYGVRALGVNPDQVMAPPSAQGKVPPELQKIIEELKIKKQEADADTLRAQTDAKKQASDERLGVMELQQPQAGLGAPTGPSPQELALKQEEMALKRQGLQVDQQKTQQELAQSQQELQLKASDIAQDHAAQQFTQSRAQIDDVNRDKDRQADLIQAMMQHDQDGRESATEREHQRIMQAADHVVRKQTEQAKAKASARKPRGKA